MNMRWKAGWKPWPRALVEGRRRRRIARRGFRAEFRRGFRTGWALSMLILLAAAPEAHAQKSTEQYIPIGRSPGLQKATTIGIVEALSVRDSMLTVSEGNTRKTVRITARTRIWIDRSKFKLPNQDGGTVDLQPGRRVEVKFENAVLRQVADWIKVEPPKP